MIIKRIKIEHLLYALALLLAVFLRFNNLGSTPLSDKESLLALEAFNYSQGLDVNFSESPLAITFSGILFFIFKSNEIFARLLNAILGSCMVLFPIGLKNVLDKKAAIILTFALAIDPLLISISRQLNGFQYTLLFILLFLLLLYNNKFHLSGIVLGLVFLSGPAFWNFLFIVIIFLLLIRFFYKDYWEKLILIIRQASQRKMFFPFILTVLLIGSSVGMYIKGISGIFNSFMEYLNGWRFYYEVGIYQRIIFLFIYELLPLSFCVYYFIHNIKKRKKHFGLIFVAISIILILNIFYPAANLYDFSWLVVILWIITAIGISSIVDFKSISSDAIVVFGEALVIFGICIFAFINLISIPNNLYNTSDVQLRLMVFIISIVIIGLITLLVKWGWSGKLSLKGLGISGLAVTFVLLVFNTFHISSVVLPAYNELLYIGRYFPDAELLMSTISDFTEWSNNNDDIAVINLDYPSLEWQLRNNAKVSYVNYLTMDASPSFIISDIENEPSIVSEYTGQDFLIEQTKDYYGNSIWDNMKWFFYRENKVKNKQIILWVRTDIFPGNE